MSTTYNPNIPDPPHAPAADVGTMQTNAGSIGNWCGNFDHFGLNNVANTGLHRQVTMPNANTPSLVAGSFIPTVFTFLDAFSVPQLRFYSGTPAQSSTQFNATGNGTMMLFGGIIIKWGLFPTLPGTVIFATQTGSAFPHNCFNVQLTPSNAAVRANISGALSPTQFTATAPEGTANFFWFAIGN